MDAGWDLTVFST